MFLKGYIFYILEKHIYNLYFFVKLTEFESWAVILKATKHKIIAITGWLVRYK